MRNLKQILELHFTANLSVRAIARRLGIGRSSVSRILDRAKVARLTWPLPEGMSEADLERILYPVSGSPTQRKMPDWMEVHKELAKHRSLTLHQLWVEYFEANPDGYQYSYFCDLYRQWRGSHPEPVMHIPRKAGERLQVDYSGKKPKITHPITGEQQPVELFVAALGTSGYIYAEATRTQKAKDLCESVDRAFTFYGGLPRIIVPDNLKSAVIRFRKDDTPILNDSFRELTEHYRVAVIPARPRHPRDKGLVESSVLFVQRKLFGALRHREYFSLAELNEAIREQVRVLNEAPMQRTKVSRKQIFVELDQPALRPLPRERYEFAVWFHKRKVRFDYHVQVENHRYSVPHDYAGKEVQLRIGTKIVEILDGEKRIASHLRSSVAGQYTTLRAHMPRNHQNYADWSPARFTRWAASIGPNTKALIEANFAEFEIPEQAFQRCLGLLSLGREYGQEAMEKGCKLALQRNLRSTAVVKRLVKRMATEKHSPIQLTIEHENIRGPNYYSNENQTSC